MEFREYTQSNSYLLHPKTDKKNHKWGHVWANWSIFLAFRSLFWGFCKFASYFQNTFLKGHPWLIWCIAIYDDDTTLYSKCDQASGFWQQLELAFELESYLQGIGDWDRKRSVVWMLEKLSSFHLTSWITLVLLVLNLMGLFLKILKSSFEILGLSFFYIVSIAKTASKKAAALNGTLKFLSSQVVWYLYKSTYGLAWNTVVICGLPPATWICLVNYRNWYVGLLVIHIPALLNPWLIEM